MTTYRRREKGANYTHQEKHLLLDKVLPRLSVIENKKTDTPTIDIKIKSWNSVAAQYNAVNMKAPRRVDQLKTLYENIKKRTKKEILTYQAAIKTGGSQVSFRKIDDVSWRLIKNVPSLRALWRNTLLIMKQELPNDNNLKDIDDTRTSVEDNEASQTLASSENIDYAIVVKEEFLTDTHEFLIPDETAGSDNVQNDTQSLQDVDFAPQSMNDAIDSNEKVFFSQPQQGKCESSKVTDSMCELEKEMKRKELEKLDLDVQMKRVELELMKGRLREQELNIKFKELEYQVKTKEFTAYLNK